MSDDNIPPDADSLPEIGQPTLSEDAEKLRLALWEAMDLANKAEFADAISVCRDLIDEYPDYSEPVFALSLIAFHGGDEGHALQMAERAHRMDPDIKEYLDFLAATATRVGRLADGAYFAKLSTAAENHSYFGQVMPDHINSLEHAMMNVAPSTHGVEGQRLFNTAAYGAAFRELNAHIRLEPNDVDVLACLARTALILGKANQAVGALHNLLRIEPENTLATALLARALVALGRFDEARAAARASIASDDMDLETYVVAMGALQSCPDMSAEDIQAAAVDYIDRYHAEFGSDEPDEDSAPSDMKNPQIGFISNAFFRGDTSDYVAQWFRLPPQRGETIHGYQFSAAKDGVTTQIMNGCTNWREVHSTDPYTLGYTLRRDNLDVLVDLSELNGDTCSAALAAAPARFRVAVTALPEPGLMPGITHILSDRGMAEADRRMSLPHQEIVNIPGSLFAREPYLSVPQDTPAPCAQQGFVTFGAVADAPNLSADFALAAGDILRATPNARLMLFFHDEQNQTVQTRVREYFMHAGVAERISFVFDNVDEEDDAAMAIGRAQTQYPIEFWHSIDILLDTFPLNGRVPTTEALWSGVPVVSLQGQRRAESIGASLLTAAEREDWIAKDQEAFIRLAVDMASDIEDISEARKKLQAEIAGTALFNPLQTSGAIRLSLLALAER